MTALTTRSAVTASTVVLLFAALVGCAPVASSDAPVTDTDESTTEETTDDAPADTGMVVLPGSGSYAIGTEAPYGGYELSGGVLEQPAGCTWSIVDEDGAVTFADQGQIVFLTDIPEGVTFITNGCPDWQQFE